jgi:hypothetical protein
MGSYLGKQQKETPVGHRPKRECMELVRNSFLPYREKYQSRNGVNGKCSMAATLAGSVALDI